MWDFPDSQIPISPAVSMGRCNTCLQFTRRSFKSQSFSWTLVLAQGDFVEFGLRITRQVGSLRKVLSQEPVRVFVGATLPRALRITEIDFHIGGHREALVLGHLQSAIPGQ